MIRRALLLAALVASPAAAQLRVAGVAFAPADIVDARASPEPGGKAGIRITFTPAASVRLATATKAAVGKIVSFSVDGKTLSEALVQEPITGEAIEIAAQLPTAEAEAIAKRISGKDPVPEEFEE
ncbi:hypothetical protein ABC347_08375 [Sphingomonas sp. 1P06PA]|uniref:SecDF P1 head subdomain-containing protein n=1 Tax=Sphingomonas sp. 1P06PA TaxID=554121 RepID=UPI0039A6A0EC